MFLCLCLCLCFCVCLLLCPFASTSQCLFACACASASISLPLSPPRHLSLWLLLHQITHISRLLSYHVAATTDSPLYRRSSRSTVGCLGHACYHRRSDPVQGKRRQDLSRTRACCCGDDSHIHHFRCFSIPYERLYTFYSHHIVVTRLSYTRPSCCSETFKFPQIMTRKRRAISNLQ